MGACVSVRENFLDYAISNCECRSLCEVAHVLDCCERLAIVVNEQSHLANAVARNVCAMPCMCGECVTYVSLVDKVLSHLRAAADAEYVTEDNYVNVTWFVVDLRTLRWRTVCWHLDMVQQEHKRWKALQAEVTRQKVRMRGQTEGAREATQPTGI